EGVDFFATPLNAVFTRTVADPKWGLKLTGKEGKNAIGVFVADDTEDGNTIIVPANQVSSFAFLEGSVQNSVLRYRRDVGSGSTAGSTLGVLYTGREGEGDYSNQVYGLDTFLRLGTNDTIRAQYLASDTRYPREIALAAGQSLDTFDGYGLLVDYDHPGRDWGWSVNYRDLDPGFRADSGFIPRVDIRQAEGFAERHIYGGDGDRFSQINLGLYSRRVEDHTGRLTDEVVDLYGNIAGPLQSFLEISVESDRIFFGNTLYDDLRNVEAVFNIQPSGVAYLSLYTKVGETVDFERNEVADIVEVRPSAELKLGRHVNARIDHSLRRLDADDGRVEANLSQLRLIYNFNVRMFVRGIFQYLDLAPQQSAEHLFTQLLFSYKLNPQTVLFLGYSDDRDSFQEGFRNVNLGQTDRSFFFKVGYAWVL
ncbi:MAG TPA: hypothetical protein VHU81_08975, partial [Thermoanaerobaculia bacterium]|nr:hypothetical protein [Thermoanaerobaculia bacterium]